MGPSAAMLLVGREAAEGINKDLSTDQLYLWRESLIICLIICAKALPPPIILTLLLCRCVC